MGAELLSFLMLAFAVGVVFLVRRARRYRFESAKVLIGEAMRSQGITPDDAAKAGLEAALLAGRDLCASCSSSEECRMLLRTNSIAEFEEKCPNVELFKIIQRHKEMSQKPKTPWVSF
ncbi:MAG: hypothetical protein NZM07_03335 [Elioraea sp.]|nr:hypothetical protein [Elioraea sp.]